MLSRRAFLTAISALPFLGFLRPEPVTAPTDIPDNVDEAFTMLMNEELQPGVFQFSQHIPFKHSDWKGLVGRQDE